MKLKSQWYVLYTAPRAEKKVAERLSLAGVTNWLPLHRAPRVWSDRVKIVEIPLFNSYVFVYCQESKLPELLKIYGISRILYYDGKPAIIRSVEIEAIKQFLELANCHELCEGEEVEILRGAMKKVSGRVKSIKKKHLLLYIEQLDATVCVNLTDVAKVNRLK